MILKWSDQKKGVYMSQEEKNSLWIVRDILTKIGSKQIPCNSMMPSERELASVYHVSRSSVREAMQVLAVLGIVKIRPKEKTRVTTFQISSFMKLIAPLFEQDPSMSQDIAQFRKTIEVQAIALAARRQQTGNLEAMLHQIQQTQDETLASSLDFQFHQEIVRCSGNSLFCIAMDSVASLMQTSVLENRKTISQHRNLDVLIHQHIQLYQAIQNQDYKAAQELMEKHLDLLEE